MSFFDDLKNLHSLKEKAEEMQSKLASVQIEGLSKDGRYKIIMDGNQNIKDIIVPETGLERDDVTMGIKEAFQNARKELEKVMKDKMASSFL